MRQSKEADERLEHIDSLHELAKRTLEDAQTLSEGLKEEGQAEADDTARAIIFEAAERARGIVAAAEQQAWRLIENAKAESEKQTIRTNTLAEMKARELIVGAQASVERILDQVNTKAEGQARGATTPTQQPVAAQAAESGGTSQLPNQTSTAATVGAKSRPTFRWPPVPGATRYAIYIFGPPYRRDDSVFQREDLTETYLTLPIDLEDGITYQWTIRAGNSNGWGKPFPFKRYPS